MKMVYCSGSINIIYIPKHQDSDYFQQTIPYLNIVFSYIKVLFNDFLSYHILQTTTIQSFSLGWLHVGDNVKFMYKIYWLKMGWVFYVV